MRITRPLVIHGNKEIGFTGDLERNTHQNYEMPGLLGVTDE